MKKTIRFLITGVGGQGTIMVRTCEIISQRLAGILTEENGPGIFYLGHKLKGIFRHDLQMLGSNGIDRIHRIIHIVGNEDVSVILQ